MEMPTMCSECNEIVCFSEMYFPSNYYGDKYQSDYAVCPNCFYEIEEKEQK